MPLSASLASPARLERKLTLVDVYAIATGAMFSSGFFLLPGLAVAQAGGSAFLAYGAAGLLILPAALSVAELSTAMPRAGGAYFFLDRAMGPAVGTVGGLGSWLALVLKSAFALLGMGAYLGLLFDVPIKPLAISLTVVFAAVNLLGAKEGAGLQRILVAGLVAILGWYVGEGALWLLDDPHARLGASQLGPMLPGGVDGFFATVGLVFVSYAGLTKVASVAEEVRDPDRNIPRGMFLALLTATALYMGGVALIQLAVPTEALVADLTPVATGGAVFVSSLDPSLAAGLIIAAAIAAFASTGNAGLMSAARYPLAMARDRLLPQPFARLGRFGTPTWGIALTTGVMLACIAVFDVTAVAKLASAFQLALFGLLCLAVIVMRESRIDYYRPGFRSPLYPWLHIAGMVVPVWLIAEMGWLAVLFTAAVTALSAGWYVVYARGRVQRNGAIYHIFARLGRHAWLGLDAELRMVLAERGLHQSDAFENLVSHASVVDKDHIGTLDDAIAAGCIRLAVGAGTSAEALAAAMVEGSRLGLMPVARGVALPHVRSDRVETPRMALVRSAEGLRVEFDGQIETVYAVMMLVSPEAHPGRHLRVLARLAERIDQDDFLPAWRAARGPAELKELLLRDAHFLALTLDSEAPSGALVGRRVMDSGLPPGVLIAFIRRGEQCFVPRAAQPLEAGDRLTIIGEPLELEGLVQRFGDVSRPPPAAR